MGEKVETLEYEKQDDESDLEAVENLVDAEQDLQEQLLEMEKSSDLDIDFSSNGITSINRASVIGGKKRGEEMRFKLFFKGKEKEVGIPWPENPSDPTSPLYRLAKWNGTTLDRLADISEFPVGVAGGKEFVVVPQSPLEKYDFELVLPSGSKIKKRVPFFPGGFQKGLGTAITTRLLKTPAFYFGSNSEGVFPDIEPRFLMGIVLLQAIIAPLLAPLSTTLLSLFMTGLILSILFLVTLAPFIMAAEYDYYTLEDPDGTEPESN